MYWAHYLGIATCVVLYAFFSVSVGLTIAVQWALAEDESRSVNAGDDVAGIVEDVGSEVWEYKPGDRVAALHRMGEPHGAYAEYSVVPSSTTFPLPPNISFEAGAGLPLSFMSAALALYQQLRLPLPTVAGKKKIPVLIYGGDSVVGAYALQLAKLSGLDPITTVAGSGLDFVKSLNAATHVIDYRKGNVDAEILAALGGTKLGLAFDAVSGHRSWEYISNVLVASNGGGHVDMVDPPSDPSWQFPESVKMTRTYVASAYGLCHSAITEEQAAADAEFAYMFYRYLSHLLAEGKLQPHPHEVLPGGLDGIISGIKALREGEACGKKLIATSVDCSLGKRCTFSDHFWVSHRARPRHAH